jgi:hypothetical protein
MKKHCCSWDNELTIEIELKVNAKIAKTKIPDIASFTPFMKMNYSLDFLNIIVKNIEIQY